MPVTDPADLPEATWTGGRLTIIHHAPEPGSESASLLEARMSPGQGPKAFMHERSDTLYHLLEGSMTFQIDGAITALRPGGTVFVPRGVAHTYRVDGDTEARLLMVGTPGGPWADYFRAIGQPATSLTLPPADFTPLPMDAVLRAAVANGLHFVGPRLPGASRTGGGSRDDH